MKRIILLALLISSVSNSVATRRTIFVGDGGPADLSSVHEAIDDANDGTIIFVHGTYTGKEEEVRW